MYYTYMIKCEDGSYYTGYSDNPQKRFEAHKVGKGAKYTKAHKPVSIELVIENESKLEAMKTECAIKRLSHKEKSSLVAVYKSFVLLGVK